MMNIILKLKNKFKKDGGTVISLVIVLMLIFPFIISGLMDITNCSMLKRQLKQQLNSATKAAANSIDVKATRNGVYRIADGVLCEDVYGKSITSGTTYYPSNYYHKKYFDSGEVFFTILEYNKVIGTNTNQSVWDNANLVISKGNYKNGYPGCVNESYSPICTYSMTGDKSSKSLKRNTRVFFTIVNNNYNYNRQIDKYLKLNDNLDPTTITIPINETTGLVDGSDNTWANWTINNSETPTTTNIYVNSYRPTAVGMAIIEYEPSKIFHIFGDSFEKIYIKEYATAELIVSDNYWQ